MTEDTTGPEPVSTSIIVGVLGKRDLLGKAQAVRRALEAVLDRLDRRYPETHKILLTSLAEGADRIAADAAHGREYWTITAILPFELDIYCQDFEEVSTQALRAYLARLNTKVQTLPPLTDPRTGRPYQPSDLARKSKEPHPVRAEHYEQAGLAIANAATVLIAVMAGDETPDKIGGTARIAQYRVDGRLDDDARDIAMRSPILPPVTPLDKAYPRSLWLVDLNGLSASGLKPGHDWLTVRDKANDTRAKQKLRRSLHLASAIDRFNRRARSVNVESGPRDGEDAAVRLRRVRAAVSKIQRMAALRTRLTVAALAGLFFLAVASWEIYVERRELPLGPLGIVFYAVFVAAGIGLHLYARRRLWQPLAEDYRAVTEALRVQIAWWEAGLTGAPYRADNYLEGANDSFSIVRGAVGSIIDAALFTVAAPKPVPDSESKWVAVQIGYFTDRIRQRLAALGLVELGSWFLFLASFGGALLLLLLAHGVRTLLGVDWTWLRGAAAGERFFAATAVATAVFWLLAAMRPRALMSESNERKPLLRIHTSLSALLIGMAFSAGIFCLEPEAEGGKTWIGILLIAFATLAGAVRYVAEKLSWEAELRGYEDALETFKTAQKALAQIDKSRHPAEEKERQRRQLIFLLGRKALAENESWLRAHRERPLEPVVGA